MPAKNPLQLASFVGLVVTRTCCLSFPAASKDAGISLRRLPSLHGWVGTVANQPKLLFVVLVSSVVALVWFLVAPLAVQLPANVLGQKFKYLNSCHPQWET